MMCEVKKRSCFLGVFLAGLCASGCVAPYPEEEYSLYDSYDVQTTASKPENARTVDEMLGMKPRPVHKIESQKANDKGQSAEQEKPAVKTTAILSTKEAVKNSPDVKGRFGSKEKRFLRKGLNAPAESMQYDQTVMRAEIVVVRGLDVQPLSKAQEQKILNDIVASQKLASIEENKELEKQKEEVKEEIKKAEPEEKKEQDVVVNVQKTEKSEKVVPVAVIVPAQKRQETVSILQEAKKQPEPFVVPVNLTAPKPADETPVFETQMPLISAPAKQKVDRIILKEPTKKIVLVPPEKANKNNSDEPRIEIYLED